MAKKKKKVTESTGEIRVDSEGNFRCPKTMNCMTIEMCIVRKEKNLPNTKYCRSCNIPEKYSPQKVTQTEKKAVELRHLSTVRNPDGTFEVEVVILNNSKKYTYFLTSEWAVNRFEMYARKGKEFHGRALAVLNSMKTKSEEE